MIDWEDRALEWRRNLLVWTLAVGTVLAMATGFGGAGFSLSDEPLTLAVALSPIFPLTRWLEARRNAKLVKDKPMEKPE